MPLDHACAVAANEWTSSLVGRHVVLPVIEACCIDAAGPCRCNRLVLITKQIFLSLLGPRTPRSSGGEDIVSCAVHQAVNQYRSSSISPWSLWMCNPAAPQRTLNLPCCKPPVQATNVMRWPMLILAKLQSNASEFRQYSVHVCSRELA